MNTEINKVIEIIEKTAEKNRYCKNKINLSIKDNKLFIDKMILEGWAKGGKNMVVEYYDIFFEDMLEDLLSIYDNYDVSYETYIWLDNTGHGTRGAPYDARYIYKDCEEEEEHLGNLYTTFKKILDWEIK